MPESHTVNSTHSLEAFIADCRERFDKYHYTEYTIHNRAKVRTNAQNNAIHKYCALLAKALNDAGYCRYVESKVLSRPIETPWTMEDVKNDIWKAVQLSQVQHDKTSELETKEVNLIQEIIARHMAQAHGITTPFPSKNTEG